MKITLLYCILLFPVVVAAQYTVKVQIDSLPASPAASEVFIAGNFNNWDPGDVNSSMKKNDKGVFTIEINNVQGATYELKFTRGSWDNVETDRTGKEISNRSVTIQSDTTIHFVIAGWKDGFAAGKKPVSTAGPQVKIMDTAFFMSTLHRTRKIWLYLPKDYAGSNKKYPVLYMHDGQNLFDNATSFSGEWGVDEALDSMKNAVIIAGIDNGGPKRMVEYNPDDNEKFGKGEGKEYLAFIVKELKPYIDKSYRTLPDKQHTYIAGSSMGGLISFYAGIYYPETFGAMGVFSPSFWINPPIKEEVKQLVSKKKNHTQQYFFYMGGKEGGPMLPDMQAMVEEMKQLADPAMKVEINGDGKHNEADWRKVFPLFYKWIVTQ
jgi:predicted alpha/beta superfamily hydrolase